MLKLNYSIAYLKFLFSATNQHGVHSPFVYGFLTRCLYPPSPYKGTNCERIMLKMIPYFGIQRVQVYKPNDNLRLLIARTFPEVAFNSPPYDLIFREADDVKTKQLTGLDEDEVHDDSIILIRGIHRNSQAATLWERLIRSGRFTVSIDLFHCGLLFFRTGQAVQHFKIRI